MGKRLIRIFHKDFSTSLNSISGKKINVVLTNKSTLYGECTKVEQDKLVVKDSRDQLHSIILNTISEIVYDKEAAY